MESLSTAIHNPKPAGRIRHAKRIVTAEMFTLRGEVRDFVIHEPQENYVLIRAQYIVVAGGSRGLGRELSVQLAAKGQLLLQPGFMVPHTND